MAGLIYVENARTWSAAGWLFDWVLTVVADELGDDRVAPRLREIVSANLGTLNLTQFAPPDQALIAGVICASVLPKAHNKDFVGVDKAMVMKHLDELITVMC